ncbi:MAG: signal peptidase I [Pseudomonadota bacterium]
MATHNVKLDTQSNFTKFRQSRAWMETKGFFNAFVVAMIIRTFLFQPFSIPSGSMYPTLMVGDFLFVNKYCYGYCNHTFPFAPHLMENRIVSTEPKQGDVVVFNNPKDEGKDYIKRLIGKPGDRIQMKQGILHVNDVPVKLEKIDDYHMVDEEGHFLVMPRYMETLPNGVRHPILKGHPMGEGRLDNTEEFVVPAGHYFMMGDNRDNSLDSRVAEAVGFVPEKNLIGRAEILFFSTSAKWYQPWNWPFALRYERLLNFIR